MFQLTQEEWNDIRQQVERVERPDNSLRFQIETSNTGRGGTRYLPYAFTEQGIALVG